MSELSGAVKNAYERTRWRVASQAQLSISQYWNSGQQAALVLVQHMQLVQVAVRAQPVAGGHIYFRLQTIDYLTFGSQLEITDSTNRSILHAHRPISNNLRTANCYDCVSVHVSLELGNSDRMQNFCGVIINACIVHTRIL